ncbi:MAG: SPOR domain-containing protein [Methylomicrobium sp.]
MVEIDSNTYQVKSMKIENKTVPPRFLITPGRSQNLELLQHLLTNTHQSIVLCGPEGVGKTGLIDVLQKRLKEMLRWCVVKGDVSLTFEEVHERVGPLLRHHRAESVIKNTGSGDSPDSHKDVVLAIDNAGEMLPGLITRFIQFAENHPELHLLFVLTHDQWHIKHYTDPAIEDCYLVEARPLLQKECREFIQHIVSFTSTSRAENGLTDDKIDAIYRQSHGIPARIIAHFPELNKAKTGTDSLTVLIIAVLGLVFLALYMQWFTASRPITENIIASEQHKERTDSFDYGQPILSLPVGNLLTNGQNSEITSVGEEKFAGINKNIEQDVGDLQSEVSAPAVSKFSDNLTKTLDQQPAHPEIAQETAVSTPPPQEQAAQSAVVANDDSWLAEQSEDSYSLQLMILSDESAVRAVIARHSELQPDLRVVRRIVKGREKFVLLYGLFADVESAKNAKKLLSVEFKSPLIRKFSAIRKDDSLVPRP